MLSSVFLCVVLSCLTSFGFPVFYLSSCFKRSGSLYQALLALGSSGYVPLASRSLSQASPLHSSPPPRAEEKEETVCRTSPWHRAIIEGVCGTATTTASTLLCASISILIRQVKDRKKRRIFRGVHPLNFGFLKTTRASKLFAFLFSTTIDGPLILRPSSSDLLLFLTARRFRPIDRPD